MVRNAGLNLRKGRVGRSDGPCPLSAHAIVGHLGPSSQFRPGYHSHWFGVRPESSVQFRPGLFWERPYEAAIGNRIRSITK